MIDRPVRRRPFREAVRLHKQPINDLFAHYQIEGIDMPYTLEDYQGDIVREGLSELTPEERLEGLPPEVIRNWLPPEERFKGLSAEEILRSLPEEVIQEIQKRLEKKNGQGPNGNGESD